MRARDSGGPDPSTTTAVAEVESWNEARKKIHWVVALHLNQSERVLRANPNKQASLITNAERVAWCLATSGSVWWMASNNVRIVVWLQRIDLTPEGGINFESYNVYDDNYGRIEAADCHWQSVVIFDKFPLREKKNLRFIPICSFVSTHVCWCSIPTFVIRSARHQQSLISRQTLDSLLARASRFFAYFTKGIRAVIKI